MDNETFTMQETCWATMLRCADIIAKITPDDVLEAQTQMLRQGATLEQISKIDRAMLAEKHIRVCVQMSKEKAAKEAARK